MHHDLKGTMLKHRVFVNYRLPTDPPRIDRTWECEVDAPSKIIAAWCARSLWDSSVKAAGTTVTKVRVFGTKEAEATEEAPVQEATAT